MYLRYLLVFGSLLPCCSSNAQFVPLTAKVRDTNQTIVSGKITKSVIREGVYYRTSDGSTLSQWTTVNGSPASAELAWGSLWDNKTGTAYRLDLKNRRAYVEPEGGEPATADSRLDEPKNPTYGSVSGIRCTIFPARMRQPDGTLTPAGQTCLSTEYHLLLKQDLTYKRANDATMHKLYEMYDVQLGAEPDQSLFDISKLFTIYRPDAKKD